MIRLENILTIDVEDWYHTNDFNFSEKSYDDFESRIIGSTERLLDLLKRVDTKATFFVLGYVAQKNKELVKRIAAEGHEIGSHGMWHKLIYEESPDEFRTGLVASKKILEDITGKPVTLYRAPSWSINRETQWALEILDEEGFHADSSIYPVKAVLYGVEHAPLTPFHPVVNGKTLNIIEFPATVYDFGKVRIPFAGGLYLRILPAWLIVRALKSLNTRRPAIVYSHPWETDTGQPVLKAPPLIKFVHYYNLDTTLVKLEKLLNTFTFVPLGSAINSEEYPAIPL